ncbi:Fatty-acid amide hydrolase 2 [Armadillidium nasatum]|uniref:Fatty-acid amide hydrolase 2 n=1 Tax=Armadillidium nasatum TaxID=96803 RepID=A0A5N5SV29_9CRUS|nr:Fatty-acid amide hydrolase 2 [Armadillidium nasatum]
MLITLQNVINQFLAKLNHCIIGLKHTCGMWSRKDHVAEEDAESVRLMKEAGAINLGVTNVPELCMWWESSNTVYGRTNCAYDVNRMPGGSSGGEASLQCACGTPMSIGSDLGGSIRLPSFFNGIFGHKPTSDVVSNKGAEPNLIGLYNSYSVTGPLCKYVDDLSLMYKVLAGKNLGLLSLDKKVDLKDINFYYIETDGQNPIVSRVSEEISSAQHKVLKHFEDEFKISPVKVNFKQLVDTRKIFFAKLGSEKGVKSLAHEFGDRKEEVPFFKELFKWLIGKSKHTIFCIFFLFYEKLSKNQDNQKYLDMFDTLEKEVKELIGDNGVIISPTQPKNDIYHAGTLFCPFNVVYTCIWNVLGFPSTQCPLGLGSNNLPLGVQVIANKHNDHLCLAVAKEIEKTFGGWVNPSQVSSESE